MSLGSNLKRLRRDKSMTQNDLADTSEVKLGHISKLERDSLDPKISTIYKLMKGLDCSADMLLMDAEKTNMGNLLRHQFERAASLPEDNQRILIDLIDKYCMAGSFQGYLKEGNKSSLLWVEGKTPDILPKRNKELA